MILVIDNYDSFTYNLVQYIGSLDSEITVYRNDKISLPEISKLNPERIVISPGPGIPENAGLSIDIVREFGKDIPILGVCLGHQAITVAFGGRIVRAPEIVHGKVKSIIHYDSKIYKDIPATFSATRYHSLIADSTKFSEELIITAKSVDGLIMSLEHKEYPVFGVQFHPESIATKIGMTLIKNFLEV